MVKQKGKKGAAMKSDRGGNGVAETIEYHERLRRLADPDVAEALLLPYIETRTNARIGMAPALLPNNRVTYNDPQSVNARARGTAILGVLNFAYRNRRLVAFNRRVSEGDPRPIIMAEGDSWFQYPMRLDDTVDHLSANYTIYCMSGAGDELRRIVEALEFVDLWRNLHDVRRLKVRALLLSAGGNDIVGAEFSKILRPFAPGRAARDCIDALAWKRKSDELLAGYRRAFAAVRKLDASIPILFHAYDYANPLPRQGLGWPRDGWLGEPMRARGYADGPLQAEIVKELLEEVNIAFRGLAAEEPGVHFVDNRGVVRGRWFDELHPTDEGFSDVAVNFRNALLKLGIG